ncbi:MAG: type II toxin-antitoxin system VapC family toxin [Anaerolineae bacterium]
MAIDTNVLVGLLDGNDKWHNVTVALRDALYEAEVGLIYFDCVINETVSVLVRRIYEQKRLEQLCPLLDQLHECVPVSDITWIGGESKRLYAEIMRLVRSSSGKLNYHDALLALICREQGVDALVSFDRDFDELDWLTRIEQASQIATLLT